MSKNKSDGVFAYQTGTKWTLIVLTALLALIMVGSFFDKASWYGPLPVITLLLVPVVAYYIWVIWQDSGQTITVTNEEIVWEKGAGRHHRKISLPWDEIGQLQDKTKIFTIGRRFLLTSSQKPDLAIQIDSSLGRYRDLLRLILDRVPAGAVNDRARKSLGHMRIMS